MRTCVYVVGKCFSVNHAISFVNISEDTFKMSTLFSFSPNMTLKLNIKQQIDYERFKECQLGCHKYVKPLYSNST
jgi:hypothetical protein